ncbi:transposase [Streptomyces atroolivaceus]|uniref:transposase n=1 Tax=Streptomyces atroolivaceus TaxID=66869 RepID=UPI003796F248
MPPPTSSDPVARVLRRASRKGVLTSCLRRTARLLSRYRQATAVAARPGDPDAPGRARPATDVTATAPVPERLLPKGAKAGRPSVRSRRQLVDGIGFRVRTGVPWRDVPVEYGPSCLPGSTTCPTDGSGTAPGTPARQGPSAGAGGEPGDTPGARVAPCHVRTGRRG